MTRTSKAGVGLVLAGDLLMAGTVSAGGRAWPATVIILCAANLAMAVDVVRAWVRRGRR